MADEGQMRSCHCAWLSSFKIEHTTWRIAFREASKGMRDVLYKPESVLMFRFGLFVMWLTICIWSVVSIPQQSDFDPNPVGSWFTKLTHWSLIFELTYLLLAVIVTALAIYSKWANGLGDDTPWVARICWAMQSSNIVISFFVFALFWCLDWPFSKAFPHIYAISPFTHGINFLISLADLLCTGLPLYMNQLWVPLSFAFTYLVFSLIFELGGGMSSGNSYVYSVLDWDEVPWVASTVTVVVLFLLLPISFWTFVILKRQNCVAASGTYEMENDEMFHGLARPSREPEIGKATPTSRQAKPTEASPLKSPA